MTLYERIRQLRIQAGMSQDDLAKAMGYKDRSMITKIESGKVDISQKKILAFAQVLNTTTSYLMGLDESEEKTVSEQPKNDDIRLLIRGLNKLTPAQLEQATNVFRAMFMQTNPDLFEEGDDDK